VNTKGTKKANVIPWSSAVALLLPLSFLAASGPAHLDKTFETTPTPRITLINLRGKVVVKGWDKPQVQAVSDTVSARVETDAEPTPATGPAGRLQLRTHVLDPLVTGEEETVDYTLQVPTGSSLEIRNRQGSVQVEKIQGDTWIESTGGTVSVRDLDGNLTARTLGGDIEVVRAAGRVEVSSINGNLRFVLPTSTRIRANTNSGTIVYQGDFVPAGDYLLSTYSGDIDVMCPASASFELTAKTVSGKLDNAIPLKPKRHLALQSMAGNSLLGTHNTGNATVELTSFSGTIHVHPQQ
jgi:DUF4097 and DUF4098 domain-containing protein YvlB